MHPQPSTWQSASRNFESISCHSACRSFGRGKEAKDKGLPETAAMIDRDPGGRIYTSSKNCCPYQKSNGTHSKSITAPEFDITRDRSFSHHKLQAAFGG